MVTREHTKVIEGRQWLISMEVIDPYKASDDGVVDGDGYALD